jgi:hypothetical protein
MNLPKPTLLLAASLSLALMITLLVNPGLAQVKQGKTRPASTSQLMKGLTKPQCTLVKDQLKEGPSSDDAWEELAMHAALINEVSFLLMDDGRCPDATWAEAASKTMRQGSADLIKAAEAKNLENARAAFSSMMKSCKACHEKHKE